jgi:hypothetical protein
LPSGATRLQQVTGVGDDVEAREVGRNITPESLGVSLTWLSEGAAG